MGLRDNLFVTGIINMALKTAGNESHGAQTSGFRLLVVVFDFLIFPVIETELVDCKELGIVVVEEKHFLLLCLAEAYFMTGFLGQDYIALGFDQILDQRFDQDTGGKGGKEYMPCLEGRGVLRPGQKMMKKGCAASRVSYDEHRAFNIDLAEFGEEYFIQ